MGKRKKESITNANIKIGYENCRECPLEYCIKYRDSNLCYRGCNFYIMPKCFVGFGSVSFTIYLNVHSRVNSSKIKYKKSLLKSINYLLNNYKELELEDCIKLTKIKQECLIHNKNIKKD